MTLKPDVIVTGGGSECPLALKNATTTIPIVFINISDPVDLGFVKSLAHPGGNITGLSNFLLELPGKQLELLKEVIPKTSLVGVISPSLSAPASKARIRELEAVAKSLAVLLQVVGVQEEKELEALFDRATKNRLDAIMSKHLCATKIATDEFCQASGYCAYHERNQEQESNSQKHRIRDESLSKKAPDSLSRLWLHTPYGIEGRLQLANDSAGAKNQRDEANHR